MNATELFRHYKREFNDYRMGHDGYPVEAKPDIPFEKLHNVVRQVKCCAFCRYGLADLDNVVCCVHPDRVARNGEGVVNYLTGIRCNSVWTNVCDAWEERTPENEDLGEPVDNIGATW